MTVNKWIITHLVIVLVITIAANTSAITSNVCKNTSLGILSAKNAVPSSIIILNKNLSAT